MVRNAFQAGWAGIVLKTTHLEDFVFEPVSPILWAYDFEDKKWWGWETSTMTGVNWMNWY